MLGTAECTVLRPVVTQDEFGDSVVDYYEEEVVDDILIVPGACKELDGNRPEGVVVSYTIHFPYWYEKNLRGCAIVFEEEAFSVIGDPRPYMIDNTPGAWNRPVEVVRVDG